MDPGFFGSQIKPQSTFYFKTCFLATEPMLQVILEIFSTFSLDDVEFPQTKTIQELGQCVHTVISCPLQFHILFWYECSRTGRLKATLILPQ